MVLDCGGGTCDTTVHVCKTKGGKNVFLAEAVCADGEECLCLNVDALHHVPYVAQYASIVKFCISFPSSDKQ